MQPLIEGKGSEMIVMPEREFIMCHHSTTPDGQTFDIQSIWDYHMSYRINYHIVSTEEYLRRLANKDGKVFQPAWSDVSYNALAEVIGKHVHVVMGRPLYKIGAHCPDQDMNRRAWSICFVGNYDKDEPSTVMLEAAAKRFIVPLMLMNKKITLDHIIGHRDATKNRTCPGNKFDLGTLRTIVRVAAKV
jgi:hypothetical protein